eukprot:31306-Pelagococcus_subviridis.AAC.11
MPWWYDASVAVFTRIKNVIAVLNLGCSTNRRVGFCHPHGVCRYRFARTNHGFRLRRRNHGEFRIPPAPSTPDVFSSSLLCRTYCAMITAVTNDSAKKLPKTMSVMKYIFVATSDPVAASSWSMTSLHPRIVSVWNVVSDAHAMSSKFVNP